MMQSEVRRDKDATETLAIAGVALAVRDLDPVIRFYREVVGLELVEGGADSARLGAGGLGFLELRHRPDALPRDPRAAGLYHTAFLLPARADLGAWLAHAARSGARLEGAADHLVSEAVYLRDPEGNGVEIYADRPRADWRWTPTALGDRVEMANERLDMIGLRALARGEWEGAPPGTAIGHVHLQVGDVEAAQRFYAGLIGLDVTLRWPQAVFLSSGGYHHHLAANTWESAGAGPRDPRRAGLDSVTFRTEPATLAAIARRSGGADLAHDGLRDPWGTQIRFSIA